MKILISKQWLVAHLAKDEAAGVDDGHCNVGCLLCTIDNLYAAAERLLAVVEQEGLVERMDKGESGVVARLPDLVPGKCSCEGLALRGPLGE